MRNKGKYTGKRTSTGTGATCCGREMNEDCHGRKNYHQTFSTGTEKAGDRREDCYNQGERQIDCKATQIGPQEI